MFPNSQKPGSKNISNKYNFSCNTQCGNKEKVTINCIQDLLNYKARRHTDGFSHYRHVSVGGFQVGAHWENCCLF